MTNKAKLVCYCAMDLHPELECGENCLECEYYRYVHLCPHCSAILTYDCSLNIETGNLEPYKFYNACGYSE